MSVAAGSAVGIETARPSSLGLEAVGAPSPAKALAVAVVGGGPAGLATALMLARRGYKDVTVYERLGEPPLPSSEDWDNAERSYNLGIGGRGQKALTALGVLDRVLEWSAEAVGRKDWTPQTPDGAERIFTERKYVTKVIQRDRLASCLVQELREKQSGTVALRFGVDCHCVDWKEPGPGATLHLRDGQTGEESVRDVGLVIGTDGVRSVVRDSMESADALMKAASGRRLRTVRFRETNPFVYKVVPFRLAPGWRNDFNYSHRTKEGITLETLPTKEGMQVGVLLFRPDDERALGLKDAADSKALFQNLFPEFAGMVSDDAYERLAKQAVSRLPTFSYAGPALHMGGSGVLLGDAIKSVKPYFGMGVNSAFEDCMTLCDCLEEEVDDLPRALALYSRRRAPEAKALVELSRGFDRTGRVGTLLFVLPLVLDTVCHKLAPRIFRPNTISFLQVDGVTFTQVRRRKWLDRGTQAGLAGLAAWAAVAAAGTVASRLAPLAGPPLVRLLGLLAPWAL